MNRPRTKILAASISHVKCWLKVLPRPYSATSFADGQPGSSTNAINHAGNKGNLLLRPIKRADKGDRARGHKVGKPFQEEKSKIYSTMSSFLKSTRPASSKSFMTLNLAEEPVILLANQR
jgi:hypothetical protein